eukprot:2640344-Amphidinium_carterae.1
MSHAFLLSTCGTCDPLYNLQDDAFSKPEVEPSLPAAHSVRWYAAEIETFTFLWSIANMSPLCAAEIKALIFLNVPSQWAVARWYATEIETF